MNKKLQQYFEINSKIINKALDRFLPGTKKTPHVIHEAMRYSINAGGKRLRPILVMAAAEICGGKKSSVIPAACAMEMIHTYSLVHDDLPAMDDDDLRRGKPTSHKVFGEDIAILTGDALLTTAFDLLAINAKLKGIVKESIPEALRIVVKAAGTFGMIGGQVADIKADKGRWKNLKGTEFTSPQALLEYIHLHKTSALIQGSLLLGAVLVGATPRQKQALNQYGRYLGLTFQVTDDILDIIGDKKKLGKRGSDQKNAKLTYPALFGLQNSQKRAEIYTQKAISALNLFGKKNHLLTDLANFIFQRDH
ncbi:MAG: polyprenyl synthetase family protein [Elusimicrobiota bacterium]